MKYELFGVFLLLTFACSDREEDTLPSGCGTVSPPIDSSKIKPMSEVFQANCSVCHSYDKRLTGPALKGVLDRVPNEHWLRCYVTNHDSLIQSGDTTLLRIQHYSPASCVIKKGFTPEQVNELISDVKE